MNGKMMCTKPLYVALAQRKEDRKAQLASQYMQRLASIRMHNAGAMPGTMYTPGNGGFFVSSALPNQRAAAFMPQATIPGAQMRTASAPRWNTIGAAAAGFGAVQSPYMIQSAAGGGYTQAGRGQRTSAGNAAIAAQAAALRAQGQYQTGGQAGGAAGRGGPQAQRMAGAGGVQGQRAQQLVSLFA
ncbi:unnamed protein product [Anisakis simplex]|uniref:Polyadenylate-binding protein (inferred by orthology to a D. melanogaster protein) n=1 Tax=Anisakis simplex TaxID=6269 RepID=A0A0M3JFN8_ANISI|nr:unnamed protein product [Anisakis simplex]